MDKTVKTGELIEKGVKVVVSGGEPVKLNHFIGDAGHSDVYHVSFRGHDYAMKWYSADDVIGELQYDTISKMCGEDKRPSEKFVWPLFLVTEDNPFGGGRRFGYLTELIPENYFVMTDYFRVYGDPRAVRFKSYDAMLLAGIHIAHAIQQAHLKGFLFTNLNPNDFCCNPESGDVFIIADDMVLAGEQYTVIGMRQYLAPEIQRSNYKMEPNEETDYYSLAIILYRLFLVDHPMEGKLWEKYPILTDKVEEFLYSIKPVFHYDPKNDSNRPSRFYAPNASIRWHAMPQEIRRLFTRAFTEGVENPHKRVRPSEWINMIAGCREKLIRINAEDEQFGEREQFVNFDDIGSVPPGCLGIKIGNRRVAIYPQKIIYQISVDGDLCQFEKAIAKITYNKQLESLMITNVTNTNWRGWSLESKQMSDIPSGKEYPISPGVLIEFQEENPRIVGEVFDIK